MKIEVVTLFPEMIRQALTARRDWAGRCSAACWRSARKTRARTRSDVHRTVDDRPYGGGPGMVMKPEPLMAAIAAAAARVPAGSRADLPVARRAAVRPGRGSTALRREPGLVLVAGRYEGIDERVIATSIDEELSVGDYVLSGGELPALVVIDALARLMEGALNDARSSVEESFATGLLDWPHYTRPEEFAGLKVPEVLQGGDHERITALAAARGAGQDVAATPGSVPGAPRRCGRRG